MPPVKKAKQAKATKQPLVPAEVKSPVISGQLEKKIKKKNKLVKNERGVIFIKHLPHGFFEDQMKKYFQQFGTVTRLRLARSKRTGGSKGFAFVEFEYPEVAQVAAETMDNYLMFQRVVKAQYIPPEHQKFNYFKTSLRQVKNKAGKEIYVSGKTLAIQRKVKEHNDWSDIAYQKRTEVKLNKVKKLQKKYEHLGIDFSSILVQPNQVTNVVDEKAAVIESDSTEKNSSSKKKRKNEISETSSKKFEKKSNKDVELEDLLGNTIAEDPEDEDWIDSKNDNDDSSSDEESYGFIKDSDDNSKVDNNVGEDSDGDEEDEEITLKKYNKKTKPSYEKTTKAAKVDRFDQLIKRKPHTGGIQKLKKKGANKQSIPGNKKLIQAKAVKDLIKTKAVSKKKPNKKGGRKQPA